MSRETLHERITDQFSYRGAHAEIWRVFDRLLDTQQFLNLGYSRWYQPHVVGSSGRRLAAKVGDGLAHRASSTEGTPLLDVGCGRGGPAVRLTRSHGFAVTGIDLVPYNVATARENARRAGVPAAFVLGEASRLPFRADAFGAGTALDSIVYAPAKAAAFEELARVVREGGLVAIADLVLRDGTTHEERATVEAFADAWDMPRIPTASRYRRDMEDAGLVLETIHDISPNSTDRFRKWTGLYLVVADRAGAPLQWLLRGWDVDLDVVTEQVRHAHAALPQLRHLLVYARSRS